LALIIAAGTLVWLTAEHLDRRVDTKRNESSSQTKSGVFYPTAEQWATLTVEPVQQRGFQSERVTEGKIAVDEERPTAIFSPYAGRVLKLFVKPGDTVTVGQPLFTVQATDMVQAQNDFISAATALNKARSALNLAQIIDKRQRLLYEGKAVPLKEVQNARAALDAAENDVRSSDVALEAARNRLRILGKTDQEITDFQEIRHDRSVHADYRPDRRDDRATQGRAGAICRQRLDRSGLHHRRFVHRLGGGLYPGDRSAAGARRSGDLFHRAGLSRPLVPGQHFLRGRGVRSEHPAALGARDRQQFRRTAQAGNVCEREDPHR